MKVQNVPYISLGASNRDIRVTSYCTPRNAEVGLFTKPSNLDGMDITV